MPVRSSTSSALRWPDRARVHAALVAWAVEAEALIYAVEELERLQRDGRRFGSMLRDETVWVRERG